MANITPSLVNDSTPVIVAMQALDTLKERVQLAKLVNRDYDTEVASAGQTLNIPVRGALTVNNKAADATVTLQAPDDNKVSVTLDKHKEVSFLVEDVAQVFARPDILGGYTSDAADRLAEQVDSDISNLFASFTSFVGTTGTDIDRSIVTQAREKLTDGLAPDSERHFVISPGQEQSLLDNDNFSLANYTGSDAAFRRGVIGTAFGFDMNVNTQLPTAPGTPVGVTNFAFHRDAIVMVARSLPVNQAPGSFQTVVSDSDTGIVLRSTVSYSPDYLGVQVTLDMLYGVAQLRDDFGCRVLSKA